ncbi:MAG: PstS family phosphate ABC transporter substrate-binding protein [Rhodoferax sp.]|nr:PstS family phosphate ABC transporter substrate-binding protein [Rhodoferax sp.]
MHIPIEAFWRRFLQAALLLTCIGPLAAMAGQKAVHLRGTEALVPMAQYMAETYMRDHPGSTIVVGGGGTFRGYKSLLDGTVDIAMVSSGVQENVSNLLTKDSPKLVTTIVGYAAIVPVVHPANPLQNISLEQLRDVFSGRLTNWKQLGGKDAPIVILIGPPTDGLTASWRERVLGEFHSFSPKGVVTDAEDRLRHVARDSHAMIFVSFGELSPQVKALSVAAQKPTADKVRDGSYPLSAPLMLVSTPGTAPETQAFLNYFSTPNKRLRLQGIVTAETLD